MALSQNELLRDHINSKFDSVDFEKSTVRRESISEFLKANPNLKQASATASHQVQLEKIAKERNKNISQYKGTQRETKPNFNPNLNTNITPTLSDVQQTSIEKGLAGDGSQQLKPIIQRYTAETIGAVFDGLYTGCRMAVPHAKELTEIQKKSLGEMWVPVFNKYMPEGGGFEIVIAMAGTCGILGANLIDGYRIGKEISDKKDKKTPAQKATNKKNTNTTKQIDDSKKDFVEIPTDSNTDE